MEGNRERNVGVVSERIGDQDALLEGEIPVMTIGVAGGTGAGKTTVSRALFDAIDGEQNVTFLSHDHYYKDLSHIPFSGRGKTNFDHPDALDTDLLIQHILELKHGRTVRVPIYDFATHTRVADNVKVEEPKKVILIEGILIFAEPRLVDLMDLKVFVHADADIRLARRIWRDTSERERTVESVIKQYTDTVRPMHERFVEPSKVVADIIVQDSRNQTVLQMIADHVNARVLNPTS